MHRGQGRSHSPPPASPPPPPCAQVLHVGDRFSDTGNDSATRDCCSILWVANPEETGEAPRSRSRPLRCLVRTAGLSCPPRGLPCATGRACWQLLPWLLAARRCVSVFTPSRSCACGSNPCVRVPTWPAVHLGNSDSTTHATHHPQTSSSSCCWATSARRTACRCTSSDAAMCPLVAASLAASGPAAAGRSSSWRTPPCTAALLPCRCFRRREDGRAAGLAALAPQRPPPPR